MDRQTDGQMDRWIDDKMEGQVGEQMGRWTKSKDRQIGRWTDGQRSRWID